nr:hypothetical protein [Treponema sp.]
MAETSGSGVPSTKTLSHRGAVLPFLLAGSRWELVSATTVCINSTFDLQLSYGDFYEENCVDSFCAALHRRL